MTGRRCGVSHARETEVLDRSTISRSTADPGDARRIAAGRMGPGFGGGRPLEMVPCWRREERGGGSLGALMSYPPPLLGSSRAADELFLVVGELLGWWPER